MSARERWIPVRYVNYSQRCRFCWCDIPRGSPGSTTGTRGTRAWKSLDTGEWECLSCRTEGFRAEEAREASDRAAPAPGPASPPAGERP
jgi:hypothetical protein